PLAVPAFPTRRSSDLGRQRRRRGRYDGRCYGRRVRGGRGKAGEQFLQRARGRVAAGHAAGQLLLLAARDRLGVALAEVAALAAIDRKSTRLNSSHQII